MKVQLFIPCFVDQFYPTTAVNMVKVLRKAGCEVTYNPHQTCCGQPAFNAGYVDAARPVCAKFLQDYDPAYYVVAPSSSCVGFFRNMYAGLFEEADGEMAKRYAALRPMVVEFSEFLVNVLKVTDFGAELHTHATYHDACAALRECNIKQEPRTLLANVRGLTLTESSDCEVCCGFGGTFAVKFEPVSIAMAEQKMNNAAATGAQTLISADWSCLMHLAGYATTDHRDLKFMHLADVLASGWQ